MRRILGAALVLAVLAMAGLSSAYAKPQDPDFDGEQFLIYNGVNPVLGDKIYQVVNPDNGHKSPIWTVKLADPTRQLTLNELPQGVTFVQTGAGVYQLNAAPFDGKLWLTAHGASATDTVISIGNSRWLYRGSPLQQIGPNSLPAGVSLTQIGQFYLLNAAR